MEEKGRETIAAFDSLMTTNRIQMMKVILSWLPPRQQGVLAVYIKFAEFQYVMQFLSRSQATPLVHGHKSLPLDKLLNGNLLQESSGDVVEFLEELLPFCGPTEQTRIESAIQAINGISKMKEMMEMMEMMKELFPEGMQMGMGQGDASSQDTDKDGMEGASGNGTGGTDSEGGSNPPDFLSSLFGMTGMSGMDLSSLFQMFGTDNRQDS